MSLVAELALTVSYFTAIDLTSAQLISPLAILASTCSLVKKLSVEGVFVPTPDGKSVELVEYKTVPSGTSTGPLKKKLVVVLLYPLTGKLINAVRSFRSVVIS